MKKKLMLIITTISTMACALPVYAVDVKGCSSIGVSLDPKIPNLVHTIILVIEIAVPIALVIVGMIDLFKGLVAQKEDEIAKGRKILIKRAISAAIIFFVIAIVKLLVSFVADDKDGTKDTILDCANCFLNGVDTGSGICK